MVEELAKKIKLLILDVDGVLTDSRIIYDNCGNEMKCFSVYDGFGMMLLSKTSIKAVIITAKDSRVVRRRARDMHILNVFSNHNKLEVYERVIKKFKVKDENVCFIGDDIIDLPIMKRAGLSAAPQNAVEEVKKIAHYITKKEGGKGAVRELIELILKSQGLWDKLIAAY